MVFACIGTPIDIFPVELDEAVEGHAYWTQLTADSRSVEWAIINGRLPDGLKLYRNTGEIAGTPLEAGTFNFTIAADNDGFPDRTGQQTFSLRVIPKLEIDVTIVPARVDVAYELTPRITGGKGRYAVEVRGLPAGLTYDSTTGRIHGTPKLAVPDGLEIEWLVKDGGDPVQQTSYLTYLPILPPGVEITTTTLDAGAAGQAYSVTLEATGGVQPYRWAIIGDSALPDDLTLDPLTGEISGSFDQTATTTTFAVSVRDDGWPQSSDTQELKLVVPVAIQTDELDDAAVGQPYEAQIAALAGLPPYTWAVSAGTLPAWLTFDTATGALAGTPPEDAGTVVFTITVTDSDDPATTDSQAYQIAVPPAVEHEELSAAEVGEAYDASTLEVSGGLEPFSWAVTAGELPAGITLDPATGVLSGTPTAEATTETFTITVTDSADPPRTAAAEFKLIVLPAVVTSVLPDADVGVAYDVTLVAAGGTPPYTWAVTEGTLPAGLALDAETGALTGTATTESTTQTFKVTITDSDAPALTATATLTLTVPWIITTAALPDAHVGEAYAFTLQASAGGTGAYAWSVQEGALPDGLALDGATGVISGTPTADATTQHFTVEVVDEGGARVSQELTIVVPWTILTTALPSAPIDAPYEQALVAAGAATAPYAWAISEGNLPDGLTLDENTGVISGTPTSDAHTQTFTVMVSDSDVPPRLLARTLKIVVPVKIVTLALSDATEGEEYTQSLIAIGGVGGAEAHYAWSIVSAALPPGLALTEGTNVIHGTAADGTGSSTYTFSVRVTDEDDPPTTDTRSLSIHVAP